MIFAIHKAVAKKRSLTLGLLEEPRYELPAVEPQVFNAYLRHLYVRESSVYTSCNDHAEQITLFSKFFTVAIVMRDEVAVKDALCYIWAKAHERAPGSNPMLPDSKDIRIIYSANPGPCGARRPMVDLHVWKVAGAWVRGHVAESPPYPAEFLADLAVAALEQRDSYSKTTAGIKGVSDYQSIFW